MKNIIALPTRRITARGHGLPKVEVRVPEHAADWEASRLMDKGYTAIKFWPKGQ